jgi:hypothetical protein
MREIPSSSSLTPDVYRKGRLLLIVSAAVAMAASGMAFFAGVLAVHFMNHVEDLPYRLAAAVYVKLAAGASAAGFAGLCGVLGSLRPLFRRLERVVAATKEKEAE